MRTSIPTAVFLSLWFLSSATFSLCNVDSAICKRKEKQALISFKQGLKDPSNWLSSWSAQENCCRWEGVHCDNKTGRVTELHLGNAYGMINLGGDISSSLLELQFLTYLDLSWNDFGSIRIPSFLGSMASLKHLDLSVSGFSGLVPHQLGNLSSLGYLNLAGNDGLFVDNLHWISHLSSLVFLDMSNIDLRREVDWPQTIGMLPRISELFLSDCQLDSMINPSLGYVNFTSLSVLGLSENLFHCEIPNWLLFNFSSLIYLDLENNQLSGQIPESLGHLKYLKHLFLGNNSFHGPIPASLGNLSSLRSLYLEDNKLINGNLPKSLGLLLNLEELFIGYNSLMGNVSEVNFVKLSKLKALDISSTSLFFGVNSNWLPPFQLNYIRMSSSKIGPKFPAWLRRQRSIEYLNLFGSGISDTVPNWFWKMASRIEWISLSNNQINGDISNILLKSKVIDLSSNCFKGRLPLLSTNVRELNIARNSLSGPIFPFLCQKINRKSNLEVLDVSNNLLSGEISHCLMHWQSLTHLNLGSNNLSGKLPNSIGSLFSLQSLHLNNNSFFGDVLSSLTNCTNLGMIDLGENDFSGSIPGWIGEYWTSLVALRLRSNRFSGNIPPQICQLSSLLVLDLANNILSGPIPQCLNNVSAMAILNTTDDRYFEALEFGYEDESPYTEKLTLVTKGSEREYCKGILKLVRSIDLSSNRLSGSIPTEISSLSGLRFLNLSRNYLTGKIPDKIGGMKVLESLDLSRNNLLGEIPQSMSNLTFLSYLNLSYNNFSGIIPIGTQLQSFDALSYTGNAELCGAPLVNHCSKEGKSIDASPVRKEEEEDSEKLWFYFGLALGFPWFYFGLALGFPFGFWGICGALLFKKTRRDAYFQFLDDINKWVSNQFCRKFRT